MKNLLLPFYCIVCVLFYGCSNNDDMFTIENNINDVQMFALDISSETDSTNILLLCKDGSYVYTDVNADNGYGLIYMNPSVENDISEGITVWVDKDGIPFMVNWDNKYIIFENVSDRGFDCAYINDKGEIYYYWDVDISEKTRSIGTRAFYDPWVGAWKDLWITTKNHSWDEHNKKALVPFLCKVVSFTITAIGTVTGNDITNLALTLISETAKSSNINSANIEYMSNTLDFVGLVNDSFEDGWKGFLTNGLISFSYKKFGISMLAQMINKYGDDGLEALGKHQEEIDYTFLNKEWQIKLSTNLIECGIEEKEFRINVATKALWEIDDTNVDNSWCSVYKEGDQIIVKVKSYDGVETRLCSAKVKTKTYNKQIPPALLTIKQDGVLFELSETDLTFTQEGGTKGVYVYTNDNITSWEVSTPVWCKITKGTNSFFIDVDKSDVDREGVIEVAGVVKNSGSYIKRQIAVKQICDSSWDGTSWSFSGSINVSGVTSIWNILESLNMVDITNFGIQIIDVANNKFSLSGDLAGMEHNSNISIDEKGNLVLNVSQDISEMGIYNLKFISKVVFERIERTKSLGNLTGEVFGKVYVPDGEDMNVEIELNGTFNGVLLNYSK